MSAEFSLEERAMLRGEQVRMETLETLNGWYPVVATEEGLWWRF